MASSRRKLKYRTQEKGDRLCTFRHTGIRTALHKQLSALTEDHLQDYQAFKTT